MKRSHNCGQINSELLGKEIQLCAWVKKIRCHGPLYFANIRDRYSELQVVMDSEKQPQLKELAAQLRHEYCIAVRGKLELRPDDMKNPKMSNGDFELHAEELQILGHCQTLPFMVDGAESEGNEALRLKYRYLDLRSDGMKQRMILRHQIKKAIHDYLDERQFLEIETPTLIRSTPEGARDYLVPSRVHPHNFYALPQSPQLYKQLMMIGGLDRYYQIARCYRDEDARGDRQPEFTQLDLEMSFVEGRDVQQVIEGLICKIWEATGHGSSELSFPRYTYNEAMERFGSDKPDLRNPLEIRDFAEFVPQSEFAVFQEALASNRVVRVLPVNFANAAEHCSRKVISKLEEIAKQQGAAGLAWMRYGAEGLEGGISRFFSEQHAAIIERYQLQPGSMLFFVSAKWDTALNALGLVRRQLGTDLGILEEGYRFAWITEFPLFLPSEDSPTGWEAAHHMFSMPFPEHIPLMKTKPEAVHGDIYDLVLNGYELGSGSVRCHNPKIQQEIFDLVGYPREQAMARFGFLLEAFEYGAPPHGGIALGLDRITMLMAGKDSIKDVIAFPKNNTGQSLMDGSPGEVGTEQLSELKLVLGPMAKPNEA